MASFREVCLHWRNKILPASKYNIARMHNSVIEEISKLNTASANVRRSQAERDPWIEFSALTSVHEVSEPKFVSHSKWIPYLSNKFNKPGVRILEVGSRNVTGGATRKPFSAARYI